jgi:hypothetical protein
MVLRNLANVAVPTIEITRADDGTWKLLTSTTFKSTELKFKLNEPFDETTGDGRKCTVCILFRFDFLFMKLNSVTGLNLARSNTELIRCKLFDRYLVSEIVQTFGIILHLFHSNFRRNASVYSIFIKLLLINLKVLIWRFP